jgi:DNA adenine methylase
MILNRLGNKTKMAKEIQTYFPRHDIYIEPFFGAGGMYFNKPKSKYNILNDVDDDVYNLFRQVVDNKEHLVYEIERTPVTETQFKQWGKGKREETDLLNAVRFLFISNFGLYGKPNTLRIGAVNPKRMILDQIDLTFEYLQDSYFFNADFREVFNKCDYKTNIDRSFCYCDPPYLDTDNNYSQGFTEQDAFDLFDVLQAGGTRWAMSEFNHPFIIDQANRRGLNIHYITERQNLMNRRIEILITNYITPQLKLFQ